MLKIIKTISILLLIFCSTWVQAEIVRGLNTVSVAVSDRSKPALQKALPQAMYKALIKISGNDQIGTQPAVQSALTQANSLVRSYGYLEKTNAAGQKQLYVQVSFDRRGLDRVLQQAGEPVWQNKRPLILVWLTVNDSQPSYVLANINDNAIKADLKDSAKQRGLPIILPAMDLQDQSFINTNPTVAFDQQKLSAAAKRYEVNSVLAGSISINANQQRQGQWLLLLNDEIFQWNNTGNNNQVMINTAINKVADIVSDQYAAMNNQNMQNNFSLEVTGIHSIKEYVDFMKTLHRLTPVATVSVKNINSSGALVEVKTYGGIQVLTQALNASRHFKLLAQNTTDQQTGPVNLYYQWIEASRALSPLS